MASRSNRTRRPFQSWRSFVALAALASRATSVWIALRTFFTITLPLATPRRIAAMIFEFLESLDEITDTFVVGVPQVSTLPLLLYNALKGGTYQIASITARILLGPSVVFMLLIERVLRADVLSKVDR